MSGKVTEFCSRKKRESLRKFSRQKLSGNMQILCILVSHKSRVGSYETDIVVKVLGNPSF